MRNSSMEDCVVFCIAFESLTFHLQTIIHSVPSLLVWLSSVCALYMFFELEMNW